MGLEAGVEGRYSVGDVYQMLGGKMTATVYEKRFAAHEAVFSLDGNSMSWKRPGTVIDSVNMRIEGRYLLVWGDLGDAVYCWSQPISFKFLSGLNEDYFAGKCLASEAGRGFREWNQEYAEEALEEMAATYAEESPAYDIEAREAIRDNAMESQHSWYAWVYAGDGERIDKFCELGDIGMKIHPWCSLHLGCIKMAMSCTRGEPEER